MTVTALAHSPLTAAAVRDLLEIPRAAPVPDDDFVEHSETALGWGITDLVCDADLTRHGHVLSYDVWNPLGDPNATFHLVFAEACPHRAGMPDDTRSLTDDVRAWAETPGWRFLAGPSDDQCEAVPAEAADRVGGARVPAAADRPYGRPVRHGPSRAVPHMANRRPRRRAGPAG
ncbi:hypothetical protein [Streptomyces sp. NPDC003023]|uniref:hypothetical protein n=1 Tax=Streptomyces sp. NPDC003023 TaxID=3364675 RepID=UPI003684A5E9